MGTWIVKTNGDPDDEPLITIVNEGGAISLHMPSADPVIVTTRKVEEVRFAMGAALGATAAEACQQVHDVPRTEGAPPHPEVS